jgi:hypothetical protein
MIREGGQQPKQRITYAFRLLTSRNPTQQELDLLTQLFQEELLNYRKDVKGALELLGVGEYQRDKTLDVATLAANSVVASIILNHDASYTKR